MNQVSSESEGVATSGESMVGERELSVSDTSCSGQNERGSTKGLFLSLYRLDKRLG